MKTEAQIVLARCKEKQLYGIRMEKQDKKWLMTWAFPIDEKKAVSEGYNKVKLIGSFIPTEKYNGCPYCHAKHFLLCEKCKHISCYNNEDMVSCKWCGNSGIAQSRDELTVSGGSM